jgi:hypothetical protein
MSKNKKRATIQSIRSTEAEPIAETPARKQNVFLGYLKNHLWIVGVIILLSIGALGAGLKYLEEDAKKQNALKAKDRSALSSVNPFVVSPPPSPTPQLKVEYLYAGSRLLAVEDANANAAPPADLAVWRPSSGQWWILGGPGSAQTTVGWGQSGDIPVPGDYDGDGKTDFCVFRPSDATWYIVNSSTGSPVYIQFGVSSDKPVAADFDGDGRTDVAVFRGSSGNGVWYILRSSDSGITTTQFGLDSDIPAPADLDGDGKADINVWRNSNTTFYTLNSSNGQLQTANLSNSVTPGNSATPVSGDYDGDGKANYALRSGADWLIRNPANTATTTTTWQLASDIPVQNDYDADGIVDIATWRPSNGTWYIKQSSLIGQPNELRQVQWGTTGDIPVPAFYRR